MSPPRENKLDAAHACRLQPGMPKRNQPSQKRRRKEADLDQTLLWREVDRWVSQAEHDERRELEAAGYSAVDLERLIERWKLAQRIPSYRAIQAKEKAKQEVRGRRIAKKRLLARLGDPERALSSVSRVLRIPRGVMPREVLRELNGLLSVH